MKIKGLNYVNVTKIKGLAESESKSINLNIVCLRFDAFIKQNNVLFPICEPIYSHGINNLKSALTGDLKIVRLDHIVCEAKGNKEVYILVERVTKKNIKIRFFETNDDDQIIWEAYGKFNDLDVHHQYAIVFKTPPYRDQNITQPVNVFIELVRPSDNARSEPRDFRYIPNRDRCKPGQKRARYDYASSSYTSSSVGSEVIPVFVNNVKKEDTIAMPSLEVPSSSLPEEMLRAMKDIDSDEFAKLFHELGPSYQDLLETDAPKELNRRASNTYSNKVNKSRGPPPTIKMEVSKDEQQLAERVFQELNSFMKTNHSTQLIEEMLNHYLGENKKTNAFHISICQNNMTAVSFFFKTLLQYKRIDLFNVSNSDSQTYLHLAVLCHNLALVQQLLFYRATVVITDNDLNTALHLAVKCYAPVEILGLLLCNRSHETVNDYINALNIDGYSALMLAIEYQNMKALKLLNMKKADVNIIHAKDGFVPLRLAIEKRYVEGVKFLLSLPHIDGTIKDFQGISPLNAAIQKETEGDILETVQDYMTRNNIAIEVKKEYDSEDDVDMEDEFIEEKPQIPIEELEKLYEKVLTFTPQCLDDISAILDKSGKWEDLADLLDISHIINTGLISDKNISKSLLTFAVETNNDSLWIIRNFLENLDELRAVEVMDRMVQEHK